MSILGKWWDARLFIGPYNLSGDSNRIQLAQTVAMLDGSAFGNATKINIPGLGAIALDASGYWPAPSATDLKEKQFMDNVGLVTIPVTVMPTNTPVEADPCYFFQAAQATYEFGGAHGALLPFSVSAVGGQSGHPILRGYVLETGVTARSGTWNSTGSNVLGALSATQYLYAVLHVTGFVVPTSMVVTIESATSGAFSSPTTRATFTTVTTSLTSEYLLRVAGPVTDTYWRIKAVITGTSYTFACALAKA